MGTREQADGKWTAGFDFVSRFDLEAAPSIDDAAKRSLALFATHERRVTSRVTLQGGMRTDLVTTRNGGGYFGDRSTRDLALSGHLAATAGPWRDLTASLQLSSGYRDPTLSDRYFRGVSGRGFITGNPDLDPERSRQIDLAVRWDRRTRSVALYLYDYSIRQLVERYRQGPDFFFRNRGEAVIRGVEVEAGARVSQRFSIRLGAAVARGEAVDDGTPLDDIAPASAHLELRYALSRGSFFTTTSFARRDERPGPVEAIRPGHSTTDIGAGWRWTPRIETRLLIRNVTDRRYAGSADANAAPAPGRSFIIGANGRI
jgi:outer membrane receptor protein involved in Fe transport